MERVVAWKEVVDAGNSSDYGDKRNKDQSNCSSPNRGSPAGVQTDNQGENEEELRNVSIYAGLIYRWMPIQLENIGE